MATPPDAPVLDQATPELDEMSYDAITAILGPDEELDMLLDNDSCTQKTHPTGLPQQLSSASNAHSETKGSAFTDQAETERMHTDSSALDLPSVPARSTTAVRINTTDSGPPDTEEDLFARLHALKASTTVPAQNLSTLTDRLAALNGPKVTAAELQDLQSRLEHLKGSKNTVPLPELESRLAKLKGTCPTPTCQLGQVKGRPKGHLIPDFDPDVEMNQEQLEALASMGNSCAKNLPFDKCLLASTHQQDQPPAIVPNCKPTPVATAVANPTDLRQLLQGFDPDEGCLSEQQLRALASMPTTGAADAPQRSEGVPQWAATLGLSTQDLSDSSEPENGLQSGSSDSDESSDHPDASEKGRRRGLAASNLTQAQLKTLNKLMRQKRT